MADYTKTAISDVIGILWKELKDNGALVDTDYPVVGGQRLMPIFPTQEDETKNLISNPNAPYLVYDFDTMSYDVEWVICKERLTFKIYAPDFDKVVEIMNIMLDPSRRVGGTPGGRHINSLRLHKEFKYGRKICVITPVQVLLDLRKCRKTYIL